MNCNTVCLRVVLPYAVSDQACMYARQYIPTGWADETILVSERPSKPCMLGAGYEVLCEGIFIYRQSAIVSVIAFA